MKNTQGTAFKVVTGLFFLFGFITCLNDILIPHLKGIFDLNYTEAMLVQVCFFSAYFLFSIPSGKIAAKLGYKNGIFIGLTLMMLGTLGFIIAAEKEVYLFFLASLFILGSGITLLQVSVNPYVTLLGPPEKSAFRLTLAQAFNSLGTTIAPLLGSIVIIEASSKFYSIELPYLVLSFIILMIAISFKKMSLPSVEMGELRATMSEHIETFKKYKNLRFGMLSIFLYVGAEVSIGSFLASWLTQEESANLPLKVAAHYVAFYWGGAMLGRFIGSYLTSKITPLKILQIFLVSNLILILGTMYSGSPFISTWAIILVGFFNSVMFPVIFSYGVSNLKERTPLGSGLICTCIVGGAILPLVQGSIADALGIRISFMVPLTAYLIILLTSNKLKK